MRISEVAARVGVATHVLRHWEEQGLIRLRRNTAGHRVFDLQHLATVRMVTRLRQAGVPIPVIRLLVNPDSVGRAAALNRVEHEFRERAFELLEAADYLSHVTKCTHPIIDECDQCRGYSRRANPAAVRN